MDLLKFYFIFVLIVVFVNFKFLFLFKIDDILVDDLFFKVLVVNNSDIFKLLKMSSCFYVFLVGIFCVVD